MLTNSFRYMKNSDIKKIVEIEEEAFSDPWSENAFLSLLENKGLTHYYVLEDINKNILGYFGILIVLDECQIHTIAIDHNYRKKGLGSLMIEKIIDISMDRFVKTINLEVDINNEKAVNLYKKFGFKQVGYIKDYYKNPKSDAYIMEKNLDY